MPDMLMLLGLAEGREDGIKLSKSSGSALGKSLVSAGWKRVNPRKAGGYWMPSTE